MYTLGNYKLKFNNIMAIYRVRRFSAQDQSSMYGQQNDNDEDNIMTSKDIQLENMKLQREIMRNQRQQQRLQEEERRQVLRDQQSAQKQEAQKNMEDSKNQLRLKESQNRATQNPGAQHPGLYKKSTTAVKPISMK